LIPRRRALLLGGVAVLAHRVAAAQAAPIVAAAANVKPVLDKLVAAYAAATGLRLVTVYGATGNLAQQVMRGAPFQLFVSADEATVPRLAEAGHTEDRGQTYAEGRLLLFLAQRTGAMPDAELSSLRGLIAARAARRVAIASPEHAPYGRAARQALDAAGLWTAVAPMLATGESVAKAAQFAATGAVDAAFLAHSFAETPELVARGRMAVVARHLHDRLIQRLVLLRGAGAEVRRFQAFLLGAEGRAAFLAHGYAVPD
jgi:molybdate transport system substrate-binding protein